MSPNVVTVEAAPAEPEQMNREKYFHKEAQGGREAPSYRVCDLLVASRD